MKHVSILLLLTLLTCCERKNMTEREFTQLYVDEMSKNYPAAKYNIVSELTVKGEYNGKEFSHYLDNAFKEYLMQTDSADKIVKRYIASSGDLYRESDPININNIVPIIKPIDYLKDLKQLSKENGEEKEPWVVYEKYNSALIIVYAENTKTSIKYFTQEDFGKLSIPRDSLRSLAVKNLNEVLPEIQSSGGSGIFMITAGGDFEASLILLTSIWTNGNIKVNGDIVVAIPNRDMLIITGSKDEQGIKKLKEITKDSFTTGNYQVSPYLFIWGGHKFELWR